MRLKGAVGLFAYLLFLSLALPASGPSTDSTVGPALRVAQMPSYVETDFPWSMFHRDPSHSGFTQAVAPRSGSLLWNVTTGGAVSSSPIVVQGTVYVGSSDTRLYAVNESSGRVFWTWKTGAAVTASPAESNGVLYVASQDQVLYALSASSGLLRWSSAQIAPLLSSPTVADGMLFMGTQYSVPAGTAMVVALNATSGANVWSYNWPASVSSSPAVDQGRVYVGTSNGWVVTLNETSGGLLWTYQASTGQISSPAFAGGSVYIGTSSNRILALDGASGGLKWIQSFGGVANPAPSSPAVGVGRVFFGTGKGQLVALNATTGTVLWTVATGGAVSSSPAVTQDTVLVGSNDGKLYALNLSNGALRWTFTTGGPVVSSPSLADGLVFFGSQDGRAYALGPPPPVLRVSVGVSPLVVRAGLPATVSIIVTANSVAQSDVSLTFTPSLASNTTGPISQGAGLYTSNYTAPPVGSRTLVVFTAVGSKPGFVGGSGQGSVIVEPPSPLTVNLAASPLAISPGGNATLMLQLLNGSSPVVGATVSAQSPMGGQFSGVADLGNGNYTVRYSPPDRDFKEPTPFTVFVVATKPGFMTVSTAAQLLVYGLKGQPRELPQFPFWPVVAVGVLVGVSAFGGFWFKGRDRREKPRPLERSLEFREALLRAVDSAFELVGPNVWKAIMRTVEGSYGVRREEIPDKLEAFHTGLVETLGQGAPMAERLILKRLHAELGMEMVSNVAEDFVATVWDLQALILDPKKSKRARR